MTAGWTQRYLLFSNIEEKVLEAETWDRVNKSMQIDFRATMYYPNNDKHLSCFSRQCILGMKYEIPPCIHPTRLTSRKFNINKDHKLSPTTGQLR